MKLGQWDLRSCIAGRFALDGGAMFGVVPKTMWAKALPPDAFNRIPMVMRLLIARGHGRVVLVDVGAGGGHSEKYRQIYAFEDTKPLPKVLEAAGVAPAEITDVVLTHLHFDHGAGIVESDGSGGWRLLFPGARHHVQRRQWDHAFAPNPRDRASYYEDRLCVLDRDGVLSLHDGDWSLCEDFDLRVFDGHSPGQQLPLLRGGNETLFFCGDLIPTQHHIPTPYIMAYDLDPVRSMAEKAPLLKEAQAGGWILFFEHDADLAACRLEGDGKRFGVGEKLEI